MVPQLELPQGGEWIVILVIVVLLFGAKKLPELSRNAARAMDEFKKAPARRDAARSRRPDRLPRPRAQSGAPTSRSGGAQGVGEERRGV